jgi:hypothetical protein
MMPVKFAMFAVVGMLLVGIFTAVMIDKDNIRKDTARAACEAKGGMQVKLSMGWKCVEVKELI